MLRSTLGCAPPVAGENEGEDATSRGTGGVGHATVRKVSHVAEALIVRARAELSRDMPAAAAASAQSSLDALGDEPLRHITEVKVLALLAEIHEQRGDREAEADVRRTLRTRCKALGAAGPPCGPGEPEARATVAQVSKMLLELQPPG